ncbi:MULTISPECIES: sensor histidine kinase [Methylosinus]|uniref:Oxygen sensor histidine kinase NreB n=1 Tax=Methylosinus trichosporium (strain ATCC 35070 / NCIMB 11131 / UNIQEM 75 / OB3b) TaxID=595536 RepID=A0A2D2D1W8_METT3|nr:MULTISPECIES: ATP-binding protein [Methylosinus]ATQ68956.1 ATP-binding protein [Methylosinus trichosporium OB3b]OBS52254.1 histidine kinase [Methylosinus sp. 3S-1]
MSSLSLKARLSWLIGVVLVATLLVNVGILILHAGPRIRAEDETSLRLTRELVLMTVASIQETSDPAPALKRFYESLGTLRHVDVRVLPVGGSPLEPLARRPASAAELPGWFVALVDVPPRVSIIPVRVRGVDYGRIAIMSNPLDELAEIWSDVSWLALVSLLATSAILAIVLVIVRCSLTPFGHMQKALSELEAGRSNVRVALAGASEFRGIAGAVNSLATTLDQVKAENRSLLGELMRVQDDERKAIARDLHDEAGPCLFSIRAGAHAIGELAESDAPDLGRLRQITANVGKACEALQSLISGLLGRLRPRGLADFGLSDVLGGLIASWKVARPDVAVELIAPHDLTTLDEQTASTAYRVAQEAMTNVFRHAGASRASVAIEFAPFESSVEGDAEEECGAALRIVVEDDGKGIPERPQLGLGIIGMRERVQALGGRMTIEKRPEGGTRLTVYLPIADDGET